MDSSRPQVSHENLSGFVSTDGSPPSINELLETIDLLSIADRTLLLQHLLSKSDQLTLIFSDNHSFEHVSLQISLVNSIDQAALGALLKIIGERIAGEVKRTD